MKRVLLASVLFALIGCPAALAHSGGNPRYTSTVTRVTPAITGVTLTVLDRDDRLQLTNDSGKEITILGYDGEPYLRFTTTGVYRNARSPATYLNDDRYGNVQIPSQANAKATPQWELVTPKNHYDWHDHRIHWMSPIDPPPIRNQPNQPHHVFDWKVPGEAEGAQFTIAGSLDYGPSGGGGPPWLYLALPLGALIIAGGGWAYVRKQRPDQPR